MDHMEYESIVKELFDKEYDVPEAEYIARNVNALDHKNRVWIYHATHRKTGKRVALKYMDRPLLSSTEGTIHQKLSEGGGHPNLVPCLFYNQKVLSTAPLAPKLVEGQSTQTPRRSPN